MVERWLFFATLGGNPWGYPIINSINEAEKAGTVSPIDQETKKLLGHIYYKLELLPRIIKRINNEWHEVCEFIKDRDRKADYTNNSEGYALHLDVDLKYNLTIDVDSLLFEINSCCELVGKLLIGIYQSIGTSIDEKDIGKKLLEIIKNNGESNKWFVDLDIHRNIFIHSAAARLAVEVKDDSKNVFELIILKDNIHKLDDEKKYIRMSTLSNIVTGFSKGMELVQNHIVEILKK